MFKLATSLTMLMCGLSAAVDKSAAWEAAGAPGRFQVLGGMSGKLGCLIS
jgi:hypothetical protein